MSIIPWRRTPQSLTRAEWIQEDPTRLYSILESYYGNLDVYDDVQAALWERGIWSPGMKAIRNPANRTVEFYASKLWPGVLPDALPIDTENDRIIDPIEQLWTWSNWGAQKQVAARWLATLGDLFIKVSQIDPAATRREKRVYMELIHPSHVVEFDTDVRGYLTYVRIDVPQTEREGDKTKEYTLTEVWDKERFRRWKHTKGENTETRSLGTPETELPLRSFGIDFVPVVHAKFRDTGQERGAGAFTHALDKIDEANRMATRLHQMLFRNNNVTWAVSSGALDKDGRPLPAPRLGKEGENGTVSPGEIAIGDDVFVRLPGLATLSPLVPNLNYAAALEILQDHMQEIEKDLPELAYYRLRELNQISGVAVRTLLSDAIDRLLEARGNAENALVRANQMALTIGANAGLFRDLGGDYASGAFDHAFEEREVIPMTETEEAMAQRMNAETVAVKRTLGVSERQGLDELGYTEEEIVRMEGERSTDAEATGAALLRGFDGGVGQ